MAQSDNALLAYDDDSIRDADEIAETYGYLGSPDEAIGASSEGTAAPRPASERIAELLANMEPYRLRLLSIMGFCSQARSQEQLERFIKDFQEKRRSVYTANNFCQMLADAGALMKTGEDGTPYDELPAGPEELEKDGQVFLQPRTPPPAFWQTTEAGLMALEGHKPLEALREVFAQEAKYAEVFQRILELCGREGGAAIAVIKEEVNSMPVLEYPNKTAQFFMDYLERHGALAWSGAWKTTELGFQALELLKAEGRGGAWAAAPILSPELFHELSGLCAKRAAGYGLLSRLFALEVDDTLLAELCSTAFPASTGCAATDKGYSMIASYLSRHSAEALQDLAVDYCRVFVGHGNNAYSAAYPFESVYTSAKRLMMQDARDEIIAAYSAAGMQIDASWKDPEDHIALELEYMHLLCAQTQAALSEQSEADALDLLARQRDFMADHLASWVPMMTSDMKRFAKTEFYAGLAWLTEGFLEMDQAFLKDVVK